MIQYSTVYIHTYIHTYCIQYSTVPISFSVPNETIFTRKTHLGSRSATIYSQVTLCLTLGFNSQPAYVHTCTV